MSNLSFAQYYTEMIDFTYQVINSLKGAQDDWRRMRCHDLATKLFFHAATIGELRNGTNLNLSNYKNGAHIVDFPSLTVLARACLDTYLRMFEIYFEQMPEDEFDYRHAVYELQGFLIRERHIPQNPDPSLQKRVEETLLRIDDMRNRVKNTKFFQGLNDTQQKQSLKGYIYPKRDWGKLAISAGFGQKFIGKVYAYQSAYVHADSLSVAQISEATTDELRNSYVETCVGIVMMILARMIMNYIHRYPKAKKAYDQNQTMAVVTTALAKAASSI